MTTRRLYVSMIVSLDGYIEGPNRELDWFQDENPPFEQYCEEMIDSVGLAIYGRRAYELMVAYWPDAETKASSEQARAFARKMNALPKVVLSRTLTRATWQNTTIVDDAEKLAELKRRPGKPIVAWAGAELVATLTRLRLIDEYRLVYYPVVLGGGTPFFKDVESRRKLRHIRTNQLGGGPTVLCYEPIAS